jgi:hypothetical protein
MPFLTILVQSHHRSSMLPLGIIFPTLNTIRTSWLTVTSNTIRTSLETPGPTSKMTLGSRSTRVVQLSTRCRPHLGLSPYLHQHLHQSLDRQRSTRYRPQLRLSQHRHLRPCLHRHPLHPWCRLLNWHKHLVEMSDLDVNAILRQRLSKETISTATISGTVV